MEKKGQSLDAIKFVFADVLSTEFEVEIRVDEAEVAAECIHIYDTMEAFFEETGINLDNPEIDEAYVLLNRICRWAGGKLIYFSQLEWEERKNRN